MKRFLIAALGSLALLAPLTASAPLASAAQPAYSSNCTIGNRFCWILTNWPPDGSGNSRWIQGMEHNLPLDSAISNFGQYTFTYVPGDHPWGTLTAASGYCLEVSTSTNEIYPESCPVPVPRAEQFELTQPGGSNYPNSAYRIISFVEGTGMWVQTPSTTGGLLTFTSANNGGTANYSRD